MTLHATADGEAEPTGARRWGATALLVALVVFSTAVACREDVSRRPSIVLISIDALRADHLGCYGYERDTSPGLDRLARESLVYDRAWCEASWTLISHMTMLTGLHSSQHGVVADDTALGDELPLLAERLSELGYYTVGLTRGGWFGDRFGFQRGFDVFRQHRLGRELDANLREELARRPKDRPFFLVAHVWDVHSGNIRADGSTIYTPPEEYRSLFLADAVERLDGLRAPGVYHGRVQATPEQVDGLVALYDGGIRYADDLIDGWIESWRAEGLLDDLVVIVTSDHGEGLCQRDGYNEDHGGVREEGLRVPLLVRLPGGRRGGERRSEPVHHVDLVPTVLDLVDVPGEAWLAGRSLLGELDPERTVLCEHAHVSVAIDWPYKHVWDGSGTDVVYDLEDDPGELAPITADSDAERFRELRGRVQGAVATLRGELGALPDVESTGAVRATDAELEELRDLGYVGDE